MLSMELFLHPFMFSETAGIEFVSGMIDGCYIDGVAHFDASRNELVPF